MIATRQAECSGEEHSHDPGERGSTTLSQSEGHHHRQRDGRWFNFPIPGLRRR
jgi:hypothetical protein